MRENMGVYEEMLYGMGVNAYELATVRNMCDAALLEAGLSPSQMHEHAAGGLYDFNLKDYDLTNLTIEMYLLMTESMLNDALQEAGRDENERVERYANSVESELFIKTADDTICYTGGEIAELLGNTDYKIPKQELTEELYESLLGDIGVSRPYHAKEILEKCEEALQEAGAHRWDMYDRFKEFIEAADTDTQDLTPLVIEAYLASTITAIEHAHPALINHLSYYMNDVASELEVDGEGKFYCGGEIAEAIKKYEEKPKSKETVERD